ncbi:thioredoxin [Erysipelothrix larvae]|uniref:Thioredoxin n=1 Tax=Erysipelothrix larvae TaxID=1514105 RepID=A0A0X8H170_9FIRM|nr:thioredoxin [Erysipelothrix larvae]AMC94195.1 thioredoxin [Erysipelothrix larvae]
MEIVKTHTFDEAVKEGVVLVDFYADWCGPCKMISPILKEVAESNKENVKVVKVDVDADGELAQRFDVMSIPTLILFKDGKPVGRRTGFMPKPEVEKFINS